MVRPVTMVGLLNSVREMQTVDGPHSSQLEWHQDGVRTISGLPPDS